MKRSKFAGLVTVGMVTFGALQSAAWAQEKNWMVRVRAVHIDTANKSDAIPALGVNQTDTIRVSNKTIPEVDISYFFTKNIAAELVLTYPQKHNVDLVVNGTTTRLGTFKHLPPTLSLQYHFTPDQQFSPYVGVGLNYTRLSNVNLRVGALPLQLEKNSFGLAVGAGVDIKVANNLYLNFDVKKVQIRADVLANGARVSEVRVDPWLIGIGLGMKF